MTPYPKMVVMSLSTTSNNRNNVKVQHLQNKNNNNNIKHQQNTFVLFKYIFAEYRFTLLFAEGAGTRKKLFANNQFAYNNNKMILRK